MPGKVLTPSPNWYCSRCSDTNPRGILGFGAKNSIFLLEITPTQPLILGELAGHTERVTGFTFCHHPGLTDTCASTSDDGTVKIWDIQTRAVLKEHTAHQSPITAVHWSPLKKELVVSGDEKGIVICWWHNRNDTHHFFPEPRNIFCLSCSPHNEDHVAVGYKDGMIVIIDINRKGEVIHRLRGHDGEIHFLSWCPQLCDKGILGHSDTTSETEGLNGKLLKEDTAKDCFLASGSRDQTIRIWNSTKGKGVMTLKLPSLKRRGGTDMGIKERIWLTVLWSRTRVTQLVSSSFGGELLLWDLTKSGKQKWTLLGSSSEGQNHSRIVFNLSSVSLQDNSELLLSTSMDRDVKCWELNTLECSWTQPTLGGFVYSLAFSPVNIGSLAIGVGDSMIRVWDTMSLQSSYDIKTFWQGIKSKVTSLCWHPTKEGTLAFGTDDGKVGIFEIYSNKLPQISSSYHRKTVYALTWGPPLLPMASGGDGDGPGMMLYSCAGEGIILQHNPWKLTADAQDINRLIRETNGIKHKLPGHSELNWKPDGKALAIGNDDGSIEIFQVPRLKLLCTIQTHHKLLNAIRWHHPHGTQPDLSYLLASGSNNAIIYVHNLKTVLEEPPDTPMTVTEPFRTLLGHTAKVTSLAWSPHHDAMLVSTCYDGTAQVWDVLKEEPLCNFRGHVGRLLGVQWSPVDADSVWTGGDDFTVRQWEVSKQEHTQPPKGKKAAELDKKRTNCSKPKSKKARKRNEKGSGGQEEDNQENSIQNVANSRNGSTDREVEQDCQDEAEMAKLANGISQTPALLEELGAQENMDHMVPNTSQATTNQTPQVKKERLKDERKKERPEATVRKKKGRSALPLSTVNDHRSKEELHSDCVNLANILYSKESGSQRLPGSGEEIQLGLFVDRPALYRMFEEEGQNHLEAGHPEMCYQLMLWKGNVRGALEMATERGELNDTLVAMAPMAGYAVWMKTIEAFSKQLCFQEQYIKAATYLLSIHKVYEAVKLLQSHQLFREAIAIAKARLQPDDPVLKELYTSCANVMEKDGHYSIAAKCYLTARSPYDAAKILAKKGDVASLRTAAEVASIVGERELSSLFSSRCALDLLALRNWLGAQDVLRPQESLLGQRLVLCTCELLYRYLADRDLILWKSLNSPCYHDWTFRSEEPLINSVTAVWQSEFGITGADLERLKVAHQQLRMMEQPETSLNTPPRLLMLHLAQELSLAITYMLLSDWAQMVTVLLKVVLRCIKAGDFTLMQEIGKIVLPERVDFTSDLEVKLTSTDPLGLAALRSLHAYLCYGQVYELWWKLTDDGSGAPRAGGHQTGADEEPRTQRAGRAGENGLAHAAQRPPGGAGQLPDRCACFLSHDHARLQALQRRTADVQRGVAELVSQHQRRSPEAEGAQEGGPGLDQGAGPEPRPEPEPAADSASNHHGPEFPLSNEETSSMTTLMEQLRDITQQQSELAEGVKLYPFPDVVESSLVLLSISSLAPSVVPCELRDRALTLAQTFGTAKTHQRAVQRFLREAA
ncbi:gem-associated protein 5 [Carcharodon carcharias]|uniref:gem-associated protein 5 n=1 Tax=Carcharodon carcharias TaxID=13397 RepID=UPI001B7DAFFC|nr:gem-associated protein 5 [Carcharodon carcharias]